MTLEEAVSQIESSRLKYRNKAIIFIVIFGILIVAGSVMGAIGGINTIPVLGIIGVFLAFGGLVGLIISLSMLGKKYKTEFLAMFQKKFLEQIFPLGYAADPKAGLSYDLLNESEMLTYCDRYSCSNYLSAKINEHVSFESSDYDMVRVHVTTDSEGHTQRTEYHYPGKALIFTFPRKFDKYLVITEKGAVNECFKSPSSKTKVEMESMEFNKKYRVYSSDSTFAFYVLTPQVQLDLVEFDKEVKSKTICILKGNRLFLFLNNYSPSYKVGIFKKFTTQSVSDYAKALQEPIKIYDYLDLDKEKYHYNV